MIEGIDDTFRSDAYAKSAFKCHVCNGWHDSLPMSYSVKMPLAMTVVPDEELATRAVFTTNKCVIDRRQFYLRGRIPVPVIGEALLFIWVVWAQVGEPDFIREDDLRKRGPETEQPYRGWLNTPIPLYTKTMSLELLVRTPGKGQLPFFELIDTAHPLAIEQRKGIAMQRVVEIAEAFIHPRILQAP